MERNRLLVEDTQILRLARAQQLEEAQITVPAEENRQLAEVHQMLPAETVHLLVEADQIRQAQTTQALEAVVKT
jgi:hypothetical protein